MTAHPEVIQLAVQFAMRPGSRAEARDSRVTAEHAARARMRALAEAELPSDIA